MQVDFAANGPPGAAFSRRPHDLPQLLVALAFACHDQPSTRERGEA